MSATEAIEQAETTGELDLSSYDLEDFPDLSGHALEDAILLSKSNTQPAPSWQRLLL